MRKDSLWFENCTRGAQGYHLDARLPALYHGAGAETARSERSQRLPVDAATAGRRRCLDGRVTIWCRYQPDGLQPGDAFFRPLSWMIRSVRCWRVLLKGARRATRLLRRAQPTR